MHFVELLYLCFALRTFNNDKTSFVFFKNVQNILHMLNYYFFRNIQNGERIGTALNE